jgi:hypothetical protein
MVVGWTTRSWQEVVALRWSELRAGCVDRFWVFLYFSFPGFIWGAVSSLNARICFDAFIIDLMIEIGLSDDHR